MLNKTTIFTAIMLSLSAGIAHANEEGGIPASINQGKGTVTFVGSIIDAPCSISPESTDQTVEMGQVSNAALVNQGEGRVENFSIKLEGCDFKTAASVDVTFSGIADNIVKDGLVLQGGAKGAVIKMVNGQTGEAISLGKPMNFAGLVVGDNTLKFGAKLVKATEDKDGIIPGDFTSTADFILQYK